jgi:Microbial-type PARG, catalytic domain
MTHSIINSKLSFKDIISIKYSSSDFRSILTHLKSIKNGNISHATSHLQKLYNAINNDQFSISNDIPNEILYNQAINFIDENNKNENCHLCKHTLKSLDNELISIMIQMEFDEEYDKKMKLVVDKLDKICEECSPYKKLFLINQFISSGNCKKYDITMPNTLNQMARQFYYICIALNNYLSYTSLNSSRLVTKQEIINILPLENIKKHGKIICFDGLSHQPLEEIEKVYQQAGVSYDSKNVKVYIHNFGNAVVPGGGYQQGALAQEEELCRLFGDLSSSLINSKDSNGNCIAELGKNDNNTQEKEYKYTCENFYVGEKSGSVILSKDMTLTCAPQKNNRQVSYEFLDSNDQKKCGIVTSFASDNRVGGYVKREIPFIQKLFTTIFSTIWWLIKLIFISFCNMVLGPNFTQYFKPKKIRDTSRRFESDEQFQDAFRNTFCAPALYDGATCIVVGAWGTGVFKNDVDYMLDKVMLPVIEKYRDLYDVIVFAAPNDRNNKKFFEVLSKM